MRIFPAIDLKNGNCVRLLRGNFNDVTEYNRNPVNQALEFSDHGLNYLHIVDLDGAQTGNQKNINSVKRIIELKNIKIQFGGGIRTIDQIDELLSIGIERVIIGTALFKDNFYERLVENFDRSQIVLALDFKIIDDHPFICTHGWQNVSEVNLYDFLSSESYFQNILATDISLDGAMNGPSIHTYQYICDNFKSLNLIASGGIKSISNIKTLKELGINESIVGKAIYEKNILLEELVYVN